MGRDEFDAVAKAELRFEVSKLIAAPAIFRIEAGRLGTKGAISGERFETRVDGNERVVIRTHDGRENRHGGVKVDADAAVRQIHHDVRPGLDLGYFGQVEIDGPRSGAASGENFHRESFAGKQIANDLCCLKRFLRNMLAFNGGCTVRSAD